MVDREKMQRHFPPAVLVLFVSVREQSSFHCLSAILLGLSIPEESAATTFSQQPEDRAHLSSAGLSVSKYGYFFGLGFYRSAPESSSLSPALSLLHIY